MELHLYRARYEWPKTGRKSYVTFHSVSWDALRWAGDYVRVFTGGYLLGLEEVRPAPIQNILELQ